jgi:hypothetical protein
LLDWTELKTKQLMQTEVEIERGEVKAVTELLPQWVQEFKGSYQS